uniref:WD_REPEATS_REGION domain-containing protein n=1 Tax=Macrostomum lignano TaxID=282301 RepID=A0A1I8FGW8_9PLAT
ERSLKYGLLESLLTNLDFLKAKCTQGNPRDLLENYLGVANPNGPMLRERKKMEASQRFQDYKQFAFDCVNHLTKYPELIYQLALNYHADSAVCQDAESALSGRAARGRAASAIVWRNKDDLQPANGGNIACQLTLDGFSSTPTCLAADSVGALAVGTIDGDVVLRQSDTGREIKSLSGHSAEVTAVCFVGAGAGRLATASKDGFVNLWDSGAGVRLANLKGHVRRVTALVANPRGDLFASAGLDGFVLLRNAATGELSYHFRTKSPINCAAFHPEGKLLAAGCWDASVKLLDSLAHSRTAVLRGHRAAVRAVAFSRHTGGHLVSGSMDGELREHLVTADTGLRPALWSSGLGRLVCAIGDSSDEAGRPATSADRVMSLAADAGFSLLASGSHSGRVRLHRPFTGQPVAELRIRSDYASVGALQFAPGGGDSCQLYCGCDDAALRLLRVAFDSAGKRTLQLVSTSGRAGRGGHSGRVTALACAPGLVMSASEDCTARLWDAGLRECSTVFNHHKGAVLACALAPDGSLGFTGANDASILVYDLSDKSLVHTEPQAHGDWVTSLDCFRATDSAESELRLVSGSNDFSVKLWRVQPDSHSLSQLLRLTGHVSAVSCVRGLPNCLASSCSGGELKLWTYTEASAGGKVRAVGVEATTLYGAEQRSNACLLARPPTVSAAAKSSAAAAKNLGGRSQNLSGRYGRCRCIVEVEEVEEEIASLSFFIEEDSDDGGAVKVSLDDIDFGRGGCGRGGGGGDWDAQVDEDKQRATMRKRQIAPTDRRPAEAVVVCGASDDGVVR